MENCDAFGKMNGMERTHPWDCGNGTRNSGSLTSRARRDRAWALSEIGGVTGTPGIPAVYRLAAGDRAPCALFLDIIGRRLRHSESVSCPEPCLGRLSLIGPPCPRRSLKASRLWPEHNLARWRGDRSLGDDFGIAKGPLALKGARKMGGVKGRRLWGF